MALVEISGVSLMGSRGERAVPTDGGLRQVSLLFFFESTARAVWFDHAIEEAADRLAELTGGRCGRFYIYVGHPLVQ